MTNYFHQGISSPIFILILTFISWTFGDGSHPAVGTATYRVTDGRGIVKGF
ncbi:MAG: hypothetical protein RR399_09850 [Lachnospiraceae bacterium]